MKKLLIIVFIFFNTMVYSQFNSDLVLQLHSGTQSDMNSMNNASDKAKVFYNTTDNLIYYYNGTIWVVISTDKQNILGSGLSGTNLTIGIENGASETVNLSSLQDNLGNHIATEKINLNGNYLSGDGGDEGAYIDSDGRVGVGTNTPDTELMLKVEGKAQNLNSREDVLSNSTNQTVSVDSWTDVPGLSENIITGDGHILVLVTIPGIRNTTAGCSVAFRITVDDVQSGSYIDHENSENGTILFSTSMHALSAVSSGNHSIKVQWRVPCGTGEINNTGQSVLEGNRALSVVEL